MKQQLSLHVDNNGDIGELRRVVARLCLECGLPATEAGNAAIIASELGTNLIRHVPSGGEVTIRCLDSFEGSGIEIISLDKGQGIYDVKKALSNGYSTAGGMGGGLGAIQRLSSEFDIFTMPGKGTAIVSRIYMHNEAARGQQPQFESGVICLPIMSETVCGDAWAAVPSGDRAIYMVADGLGHGHDAATAATAAVAIFRKNTNRSAHDIVEAIHEGLRHTRGAAVAVAEIDLQRNTLSFTGIGNIAAQVIYANEVKHLVSHNGIAGHEARKIGQFSYPWRAGSLLVMSSDGLITHWDLSPYDDILQHHPSLITGILYRDYNRGRDDITALAIRGGQTGKWTIRC